MSPDVSERSDHCRNSLLMSIAKTIANWISTYALYISYLIFFYPYILKVLYFLSPLLILLLATALCALSTTTSNRLRVGHYETRDDNISRSPVEEEAYKIIFDTFHDSSTSFSDESDENEAYNQIKIDDLPPEIVKSCCSSNPLLYQVTKLSDESDEIEAYKQNKIQELPVETVKSCISSTTMLHSQLTEIAAKTAICDEDEQSTIAVESEHGDFAISSETEIIKHMVCSTINKHQTEDDEQVKSAVELEINKAESISFTTTTTQKSEESNESINNSQIHSPTSSTTTTTTDLHKTNRSYDFSSIGSMRREKEWRRTLACKLFEERHNNRGGEEGMDMLWETIEESIEPPRDEYRRSVTTVSRRSSLKSDRSIRVYEDEDAEPEEENVIDDDVAASGKMCCLQALKMSSGKVNLGIKTKNMIKISKVIRGFGWLHKTNSRK